MTAANPHDMSMSARLERQAASIETLHDIVGRLVVAIRQVHPPARCAKKRLNTSLRTGEQFKPCEVCDLAESQAWLTAPDNESEEPS